MRALPRSRRPAGAALLVALLGALLGTTGCAGKDDAPSEPVAGSSPAAPSSSAAPEPTTSPTTATATPTPTPVTLPLVDRLLPSGRVPGLNDAWVWQDGDTGAPTADPFGVCARADLLSIGATDVVARTYFPPDDSDDNAAEQVAEFPDVKTARLAWSVLRSWYERCGTQRAGHPGLAVRPLQPVPVPAGTARWYLLSWTPDGEETGRFEAFGAVLAGTRVALLRMDHSGQDHDYPPGQDPMVGMVRAAAALLG